MDGEPSFRFGGPKVLEALSLSLSAFDQVEPIVTLTRYWKWKSLSCLLACFGDLTAAMYIVTPCVINEPWKGF